MFSAVIRSSRKLFEQFNNRIILLITSFVLSYIHFYKFYLLYKFNFKNHRRNAIQLELTRSKYSIKKRQKNDHI